MRNFKGNYEMISASDVAGQYIQKRTPTQWQVAPYFVYIARPLLPEREFRNRLGERKSEKERWESDREKRELPQPGDQTEP